MLYPQYGQIMGDFSLRYQALTYALVMFLVGFLFPNVDNWGHFGGFVGGYITSRLGGNDPRYPEGLRHLFVALGRVALSAFSILASIVHSMLFLRF